MFVLVIYGRRFFCNTYEVLRQFRTQRYCSSAKNCFLSFARPHCRVVIHRIAHEVVPIQAPFLYQYGFLCNLMEFLPFLEGLINLPSEPTHMVKCSIHNCHNSWAIVATRTRRRLFISSTMKQTSSGGKSPASPFWHVPVWGCCMRAYGCPPHFHAHWPMITQVRLYVTRQGQTPQAFKLFVVACMTKLALGLVHGPESYRLSCSWTLLGAAWWLLAFLRVDKFPRSLL